MVTTAMLLEIRDYAEQMMQDPLHPVDPQYAEDAKRDALAWYEAIGTELRLRELEDFVQRTGNHALPDSHPEAVAHYLADYGKVITEARKLVRNS